MEIFKKRKHSTSNNSNFSDLLKKEQSNNSNFSDLLKKEQSNNNSNFSDLLKKEQSNNNSNFSDLLKKEQQSTKTPNVLLLPSKHSTKPLEKKASAASSSLTKKKRKNIKSRVNNYATMGKLTKIDYYIPSHLLLIAISFFFNYKYRHAHIILQPVITDAIKFGVEEYLDEYGLLFLDDDIALYTNENLSSIARFLTGLVMIAHAEKKTVICIPLTIHTHTFAHANVLIFRPELKVLEWYEPHGNQLFCHEFNNKVPFMTAINRFTRFFEKELSKAFHTNIFLFSPKHICENRKGPQHYDDRSLQFGRCALWVLLIMQLAITSPNVSGQTFMKKFQDKESDDNMIIWHTSILNGFIIYFNSVFKRYYHISIYEVFLQEEDNPNFVRFYNKIQDKLRELKVPRPSTLHPSFYELKDDENRPKIYSTTTDINYSTNDNSSFTRRTRKKIKKN